MRKSPPIVPVAERFWSKVDRSGSCWIWTAHKDRRGYGRFWWLESGRAEPAQRAAYMLTKGRIRKGMYVCHSCDNPSCVNPEHLWLGNSQDNNRDMRRKLRARFQVGLYCRYGHFVVGENVYKCYDSTTGNLKRVCRACRKRLRDERQVRIAARAKAAGLSQLQLRAAIRQLRQSHTQQKPADTEVVRISGNPEARRV